MQQSNLRQYTVRLQVAGASGTGFFVAPGLIITCAHVVREAKDELINVRWQNQDYTAVIENLPEDPEKVDLALLRFSDSVPDHSCVSLDEDAKNGDQLYTFGYTDDYPNGDPSDFIYIDLTGDEPPLIKFKLGQVQPGFSGSPLLNLRTGKVCGVVKRSRDIYSNLGGRAIPTSVIFAEFPELKPSPAEIPPNPFVPLNGRIDDPKLFFDREREIRYVFETLNSGSSVALIGERGIGKSSLLQAICQKAESQLQEPRKPVYIDLQDICNEDDFYLALCDQIGIPVNKGYLLYRNLKKHRLLLALDKVEKITWEEFTDQISQQLRGLAEGSKAPLRLVVASRIPLSHLFFNNSDNRRVSPFENICLEEKISLWDETTVRDFLGSRLVSHPIRFSEEEIVQLVRESRGHPKILMNLCHKTYAKKNNKQQITNY